jgi:hypothetical protein
VKIIRRVDPSFHVVKYNRGWFQGRVRTSLEFESNYEAALLHALDAVASGCTNVSVTQYREVLHTHHQIVETLANLGAYPTTAEIVEQAHHASRYNVLAFAQKQHGFSGGSMWGLGATA